MAELNMSLLPQYQSPIDAQAKGFSYAQAVQQAATSKQAGGLYASGDRTGAAQTLAQSGDIKGAQGIEEGQQKSATAGQDYITKSIPVFEAAAAQHAKDPDGGAQGRAQMFDQIAQEAQQQTGASPQQLAQIKQLWVNDPGTFLQKLKARQPEKYQTVGHDIVRMQGNTVTPVYHGQKDAPSGYEYGPDGKALQPMTGGPADPKVVHALGLDRREITVNNPMPNAGSGYRMMTTEEKQKAGLPSEAAFQISDSGKIDRVGGNNTVRPIPASALAGIQGNRLALQKIDRAIAALEKNPDAVGLKTYAGDAITQRIDPKGVSTRAIIADIGSQKMHDRSGAAVTISEAPRLQPFIPSVHDTSQNAITKLKQLRIEYESNNSEAEAFYSPEAGYMSLPPATGAQSQAAPQDSGGGWSVKRVK